MEAINAMVALKRWTPQLTAQKVVLHSDSDTAVAILQAGRGHNAVIQACMREIWCVCVINDINLNVVYTPGEQLTDSADVLSWYHMGGVFRAQVKTLRNHGIHKISLSHDLFNLSPYL